MPLEANLVIFGRRAEKKPGAPGVDEAFYEGSAGGVWFINASSAGTFIFIKKYWKEGKSISEFLCRSHREYQARIKDIEAVNKKRGRVKEQIRSIQVSIKALQRQLDIVRRAYESSRH